MLSPIPVLITTLALLTTPLLAIPAPLWARASTSSGIIFQVTAFTATVAPENKTSSLAFTFTDARQNFTLTTKCHLDSVPASSTGAPGIYSDDFASCDVGSDVQFRYMNDGGWIEVDRKWDLGGGMSARGFSAQGTYWADGVNRTQTVLGTVYSRAEEWDFKVSSLSAVG